MTLYRIVFFHRTGLRKRNLQLPIFNVFFINVSFLSFGAVMSPNRSHTFFRPVHSHVSTPCRMAFSKKTVQRVWTKTYRHSIRLNRQWLVCHGIVGSSMPATFRSVWPIPFRIEHNTKHWKCWNSNSSQMISSIWLRSIWIGNRFGCEGMYCIWQFKWLQALISSSTTSTQFAGIRNENSAAKVENYFTIVGVLLHDRTLAFDVGTLWLWSAKGFHQPILSNIGLSNSIEYPQGKGKIKSNGERSIFTDIQFLTLADCPQSER